MMNNDGVPPVLVPADPDMANEPAVTLGKQFADATFVKALVLAVFTIVGTFTPQLIPQLDDALANAISSVVVVIATLVVGYQARAVPTRQAKATREVVFSPAVVAKEVAKASTENRQTVDLVVVNAPLATPNE